MYLLLEQERLQQVLRSVLLPAVRHSVPVPAWVFCCLTVILPEYLWVIPVPWLWAVLLPL